MYISTNLKWQSIELSSTRKNNDIVDDKIIYTYANYKIKHSVNVWAATLFNIDT